VALRFHETAIAGVLTVEIDPMRDARGFFARTWCRDEFAAVGVDAVWVQENLGRSPAMGTLRGMHLQRPPHDEVKLVRCVAGRIQDVAVDLRPGSPTYRRWVGAELSAERGDMLLVPTGCEHGYLTLEPDTDVLYLTSAAYDRASATGVRFDDPALGIEWAGPIAVISDRDRAWPLLDGET